MRKKRAALVPVLFVTAVMGVYADFGIGVQGGISTTGNGLSLLLSAGRQAHFSLDWVVNQNGFDLGFTADCWAVVLPIKDFGPCKLDFFGGLGFYAQTGYWDDASLAAGLRIPLGIDFTIQRVDIFLQAVPSVGIGILPEFNFGDWWALGGNLGVRIWL